MRQMGTDFCSPASFRPAVARSALANGLWRLAHKGLSPSRNFGIFTPMDVHTGHTQWLAWPLQPI